MGSKSSRLQKSIFPRSKTKWEARLDMLQGKKNEYPSIPASSQNIQVDPVPTPDYSALLRNVAANIKSKDDNHRFRSYTMNDAQHLPKETEEVPRGFLDREALTAMFVTERYAPDLHLRFNLTEEELKKIFSCYGGYRMSPQDNTDWVDQILEGASAVIVPNKHLDETAMMRKAETDRLNTVAKEKKEVAKEKKEVSKEKKEVVKEKKEVAKEKKEVAKEKMEMPAT